MESNTSYTKIIIAAFFILCSSHPLFGQDQAITPEQSKQIISKIQSKLSPLYKKYIGIAYIQEATTKTYDAKSGELKKTSFVKRSKRDYFYKEPEITALEYKKNGKDQPLSDYKPSDKVLPIFYVFDESGPEQYEREVIDQQMINGQPCYHLQITPKTKTPRHIIGDMYFTENKLDLIYRHVNPAELSFPVKSYEGKQTYSSLEGIPVPVSAHLEILVRIPFVLNERIVVDATYSEIQLISPSE